MSRLAFNAHSSLFTEVLSLRHRATSRLPPRLGFTGHRDGLSGLGVRMFFFFLSVRCIVRLGLHVAKPMNNHNILKSAHEEQNACSGISTSWSAVVFRAFLCNPKA